jgi:hypothetical protein
MEEHLADMRRVQKKKLALADSRAMELNDLRPSQDNQMMEPSVEGAGAGADMAAGLARVIGSGKRRAKPMSGGFLGALASLAIPLIGKLFGKGAMSEDAHKKLMALMKKRKVGETGRLHGGFLGALAGLAIPLISSLFGKGKMTKEAHDELSACFNKMKGDMKGDMDGGAKCMSGGAVYSDPAFGIVNEEKAPFPAQAVAVGAGKYGSMLRSHLMKLKGEGFVKDFAHGFMGTAVPDPHAYRGDIGVQHSLPMKMRQAKIDKSVGKGLLGKDGKGQRKMAGGAVSDVRKARGQAVSKLMKEKGMSLGEASRYIKENGF